MRGRSNPSDDALATLVDKILDGPAYPTNNSKEEMKGQDLEDTVRLLQKHIKPTPPNQEITRRIQTRLASEWRKSGPGERNTWQARKKTQQILILSFATIVVVLAISTIFLMPDLYRNLQGSATEISPITALVGLTIVILVLITWIIIHNSRRRKK